MGGGGEMVGKKSDVVLFEEVRLNARRLEFSGKALKSALALEERRGVSGRVNKSSGPINPDWDGLFLET